MGITFHKIRIENLFVLTDCFFAYKRKKPINSCKNEQVIHKLFSKCGKLGFRISGDVEKRSFFVETDREPQRAESCKNKGVDFIINYIYNRPCV